MGKFLKLPGEQGNEIHFNSIQFNERLFPSNKGIKHFTKYTFKKNLFYNCKK